MAHLGLADPWGTTSAKASALLPRATGSGRKERMVGEKYKVVLVEGEHSPLLPQVIDVLTNGECGTTETAGDPLLHWAYAGVDGVSAPLSAPPTAHRLAWFRWMAVYTVHFGISRNSTYALVEANDPGRVVAAAVTCPPRTVAFSKSYEEMGINIRRAGMQMGQEILCTNLRQKSLSTWMAETEQVCHAHLNTGNYFYISMFATRPDRQNQGCGSALLRFLGEVADADGVPSYLGTAGVRNVSFYAKKGGYAEIIREPIAGFQHEGVL